MQNDFFFMSQRKYNMLCLSAVTVKPFLSYSFLQMTRGEKNPVGGSNASQIVVVSF